MNAIALVSRFLPCACLAWGTLTLTAQDTAITYQGRLSSGPNPATGSFDLWFTVHDALAGGNQVGASITNLATPVSGGLFVVDLDFGPGVFTGAPRWLEINVRTNGTESFTTLSPRQRMAPTPYALYAHTAGTATTATSANAVAPGAVGPSGLQDGAVDSSKIADETITGLDLSSSLRNGTFWRLGGNVGTTAGPNSLGTTDNQPLALMVNGQRALRVEPTAKSPNLIGGFYGNYVGADITGATIGGGGIGGEANSLDVHIVPPEQGGPRRVVPDFGTISGGSGNRIQSGSHGTIAGGGSNSITGWSRFYDSGDENSIGGGSNNRIASSIACTIAGGQNNWIYGIDDRGVGYSIIGGGRNNRIYGAMDPVDHATIAGGQENTISYECSSATIGGGARNRIVDYSSRSVIAGGVDNVAAARVAAIAGGSGNAVFDPHGAIGGGESNRTISPHATIGGGRANRIWAPYGTIPGGAQALARNHGQLAYASGQFQDVGDAQTSVYVCRRTTTSETVAELLLDGVSARIDIPDNATWSFDILVTGRTATGVSAGYQVRGAIVRNAGATTFIGTPVVTVLGEDVASWSAEVVADDANDALVVLVTGAADTTIRWVASVRTVEVIF